ncbi:MAG: transporter substrate-binding domain-containing protein, partial [Chloroflexi bacterium]|nr:transporter substrate-binding domain-containing protein [Chloroflexota bacterium]
MIIPVLILDRLQQDYVGVETRRFKFASGSLAHERLGFIFAQGSDLVQPVNLALRELHQNGTLDALAQSYFTDKFKVTYSDIE